MWGTQIVGELRCVAVVMWGSGIVGRRSKGEAMVTKPKFIAFSAFVLFSAYSATTDYFTAAKSFASGHFVIAH